MAFSPYPYDTLYVEPEPVAPPNAPPGGDVLTSEQVERWQREGYLFLHGVWPQELIAQAAAESLERFPQPPAGDVEAAAALAAEAAERGNYEFPSVSAPATNEVTLHARCWKVIEQLLGTDDLRLAESIVISKYGANGQEVPWHASGESGVTGDQQLHQDYSSDTLLIPPPADRAQGRYCEGVQCLLYYTNTDEGNGGPTMGVWDNGPVAEDEWQRDYNTLTTIRGTEPEPLRSRLTSNPKRRPDVRPDLYARERPLRCRVGTAVFYRYELWHRGSAMKPAGLRVMHSFAFRRADAPWLGGVAAGYGLQVSRMPRSWVAGLTVRQRSVLGFPQPGNRYWTADTIEGVAEHYPGIDMSEYISACPELTAHKTPHSHSNGESDEAPVGLREELPPVPGRWHFNPDTRYVAPERVAFPEGGADPARGGAVLSDHQIKRWQDDGFLVLDGLLPEGLVAACAAAAEKHGELGGQFPYGGPMGVFNEVTLHKNLLTAAAQILEDDDMRIYNAHTMFKRETSAPHGEQVDFAPGEQGLHQDYSNNSLVVPPRSPDPTEVVSFIIYFSHIAEQGGATCVVSDRHLKATLEEDRVPRTYAQQGFEKVNALTKRYQKSSSSGKYGIRSDNTHPLYRYEKAVEYRPGTVLMYKFDTLHRGTPVKPGCAGRFTLHIGLRRAAAEWTTMHDTVIRNGAYPPHYIGSLTPYQRTVIHYPPPGHPYWTETTCSLVAGRYAGWDPAPYLSAMSDAANTRSPKL